jgi:hypothetical protein
VIAHVLAALVGSVIAIAGALKIVNRAQWIRDANAQHLWPAVTHVLPFLELLLGALLIVLPPHAFVLGSATLLLLIFTTYLVALIASKSNVPCACFGSRSSRPPSGRDVLRNLALMVMLFISAAVS